MFIIIIFWFSGEGGRFVIFIIVFRLGSDKLSPVSSTVFPKGSVTGCDWCGGGWMIFHFRLFKSILFFVN